jgi:hypothetical protein
MVVQALRPRASNKNVATKRMIGSFVEDWQSLSPFTNPIQTQLDVMSVAVWQSGNDRAQKCCEFDDADEI